MKVLYKPAAKNICIQAVMTTSSKQTMWFAPIQEKHKCMLYLYKKCTLNDPSQVKGKDLSQVNGSMSIQGRDYVPTQGEGLYSPAGSKL